VRRLQRDGAGSACHVPHFHARASHIVNSEHKARPGRQICPQRTAVLHPIPTRGRDRTRAAFAREIGTLLHSPCPQGSPTIWRASLGRCLPRAEPIERRSSRLPSSEPFEGDVVFHAFVRACASICDAGRECLSLSGCIPGNSDHRTKSMPSNRLTATALQIAGR
jgi:hypothetical protein